MDTLLNRPFRKKVLLLCTLPVVLIYTYVTLTYNHLFVLPIIPIASLGRTHTSSDEVRRDVIRAPGDVTSACAVGGKHASSVWYGINLTEVVSRAVSGSPCHPLPQYRNPCWLEELSDPQPYNYSTCAFCRILRPNLERVVVNYTRMIQAGQRSRPRCLPYFYIGGVTKSGTTDLWNTLLSHPHITRSSIKEPNWWTRRRTGYEKRPYGRFENTSLAEYLNNFDHAALEIERTVETGRDGKEWHPMITMDASSMLLWEDDGWHNLPSNAGLTEPRVTSAHSLRAVQPHAKLVFILRHPSDRVYSHYNFLYGKTHCPDDFHLRVVRDVGRMRSCISEHSVRECVYNVSLNEQLYYTKIFLRASLYSVFVKDFLSVFPRSQLLVIKSEDYFLDQQGTVDKVLAFLGLHSVTIRLWASTQNVSTQGSHAVSLITYISLSTHNLRSY